MQVIGFNFTKISAERFPESDESTAINTNIEFTNLSQEKLPMFKDSDVVKVSFKYTILHGEKEEKKKDKKQKGEVIFEGNILMSATKEESKEVTKFWKKKELPGLTRISLFNLIMKKCSPKALDLEDQINLPLHLPFPQLKAPEKNE